MDLTREFILWRLGARDRSEIIDLADREMAAVSNPSDALIDLSLSAQVDDYEFAGRLSPFVDHSKITKDFALPLIIELARGATPETAEQLCHGISQLMDCHWRRGTDHPIDHLFYPLDHYLHENHAQFFDRNTEITSLLKSWIASHDKQTS